MADKTPRIPAAPCVAAFCATCDHAHVGQVCDYQMRIDPRPQIARPRVVTHESCGCKEFTRQEPTRCAFSCGCESPKCGCDEHCQRHAHAILAHRDDPEHELHGLALTAHHPRD